MILGLTGGIASGKSTVSKMFAQHGFPVIDADIGAREVVEPGSLGLQQIQEYFGDTVIQEDGTLNRAQLGKEIFNNSLKRQALNHILAQDIRKWIDKKTKDAKATGCPLIVLDIPLLFEAGYDKMADKTMVVAVSQDIQLERLMNRNNLAQEEALNRIHAQMPLSEKIKRADFLIDNDGTIEETKKQVDDWLAQQGLLVQNT